MSLISALVSVLRAAPVIERFVLLLGDRIREAKAKANREEKFDHIDAAMRRANGMPDSEAGKRPEAD